MIPLLIFIAALVIIGFITFLFVYNFRTKHSTPPVPPEFNDDFSREFNLGRRNNMPRAIAPPIPPRKQNTAGVRGMYVNKNGIMLYEPVADSMQNGYNIRPVVRVRFCPTDTDETFDGTVIEETKYSYVVTPDDNLTGTARWNKKYCDILS